MPVNPAVARVGVDHAQLGQLLAALERADDASSLRRLLGALRELLVAHFESEERPDGFFDTIQAHVPWEGAAVDALRHEHGAFLLEIDRIRALSEARGMRADVPTLVAALRDHERREGVLLNAALGSDMGGGG